MPFSRRYPTGWPALGPARGQDGWVERKGTPEQHTFFVTIALVVAERGRLGR
jgi:hypothetical protein